MLVNKSMLQGALAVCRPDREFPAMDCVCVERDGTVVAMNKMVLYIAQPVLAATAARVPFGDKGPLAVQCVLGSKTVEGVVRSVPRDTLFAGLLEHVALTAGEGSLRVGVEVRDGQREVRWEVRRVGREFSNWRAGVREVYGRGRRTVDSFTFNRKRLTAAVEAVEAACRYDGAFAPLFCTILGENRMLLRAVNELTNQRIIMIFNLAELTSGESELGAWEKEILMKVSFTRRSA